MYASQHKQQTRLNMQNFNIKDFPKVHQAIQTDPALEREAIRIMANFPARFDRLSVATLKRVDTVISERLKIHTMLEGAV